jgi:FkbM family methyltransferase
MIKMFPSSKISSFEANPIIFSLLTFNCKNETNIRTYPFAVSDATGELISMEAIDTKGRINSGTYGVSNRNSFLNQCITLKIDDFPLEGLDFVKMDVQGSELKALIGMRNTLEKFTPIIFLEIEECHLLKNRASSAEGIRFIHALGNRIYRIENDYPVDHIALPTTKKVSYKSSI